jgi:Holliday junction resolvase
MRRAAKRDENEPEIVAALELAGAKVERLSGKGIPDLLVGYRLRNFLIEVKEGKKKLTEDQCDWHLRWTGNGEVVTVRTRNEALEAIGSPLRVA